MKEPFELKNQGTSFFPPIFGFGLPQSQEKTNHNTTIQFKAQKPVGLGLGGAVAFGIEAWVKGGAVVRAGGN